MFDFDSDSDSDSDFSAPAYASNNTNEMTIVEEESSHDDSMTGLANMNNDSETYNDYEYDDESFSDSTISSVFDLSVEHFNMYRNDDQDRDEFRLADISPMVDTATILNLTVETNTVKEENNDGFDDTDDDSDNSNTTNVDISVYSACNCRITNSVCKSHSFINSISDDSTISASDSYNTFTTFNNNNEEEHNDEDNTIDDNSFNIITTTVDKDKHDDEYSNTITTTVDKDKNKEQYKHEKNKVDDTNINIACKFISEE